MVEKIRGFEEVSDESICKLIGKCKEENKPNVYYSLSVKMPLRGTKKSSGYDFFNIERDILLLPNKTVTIWTNVKAYMQDNEFLMLIPRSSIGIKKNIIIANTVGDVDSDYYNNVKNEGNIGIFLKNIDPYESVVLKAGEAVVQGIFLPFLVSDNCNSENERVGGIGSTSEVK